jgi:GNAT superfamily N-acetyltransferase
MIRQFQPDDARPCSSVIRSCIENDAGLEPDVRQHLLRRESPESIAHRALLYYVAVYVSEFGIVGLGGVDMNEIRLLSVTPAFQRAGIGSTLLRHLEEMVPPALFPDIFVYSAPTAVGFYRAHGFLAQGDFPFEVEDLTLPTVFMTKPLRV